ncbi:MAG: hypothetical protein ABRQ37_00220 [Candidatus Eremiobacterota bacterium]
MAAIKEQLRVKDIFDQHCGLSPVSQVILVDLEKVERVLNSLNKDSFSRDIYPQFIAGEDRTLQPGVVKESHLKKLISIFGEKKFSLSKNALHRAFCYLFEHNTHNNGKRVKDKLLKLISFGVSNHCSLGNFSVDSIHHKNSFFGWLTREEIEDNFMKILEALADLHEIFNLEKKADIAPALTLSILEHIYGEKPDCNVTEIAGQFEEMIKVLFYSFRRANEYKLDLVFMEEDMW